MAGGLKTCTWLIRLIQLFFAIILVGVLSYIIDQFRRYGFRAPRSVIVPEVFSVLAIVVTGFSILCVFFLGYTLQLVAAFLDLVMFAGYLASAILLRHNYHRGRVALTSALIAMRKEHGLLERAARNTGLVRLLVGLTVIQTVLFFNTSILSVWVARETERKKDRERGLGEKKKGHTTA